ncbi:MAG: leucine--tRNA ligase [bacterium]
MYEYNHQKIESKWQKKWEEEKTFSTDFPTDKKKFYCLDMFPYPSGDGLHVGHPEGYTATDIISHHKRLNGFEVLHPMGWDSFGLPAENFAIKTGTHPAKKTEINIANFKKQIKAIGLSYDWDREINTSDPKFYKWTQWLFLQLYKKGLAYKKSAPVNWCDDCKTVLANEQVIDGKCERCGAEVIQKELEQWFFKQTAYVEEILEKIDDLDWSESLKTTQKNWIGKSEGASIKFALTAKNKALEVFTTRPDTLFGATYMVIAPEHKVLQDLKNEISNWSEVEEYIKQAQKKNKLERTDLAKEKTGVEIKGISAINPATKKEIPIWVADYVLLDYGTGSIMAVPAHDQRDNEFAKKYNLPIEEVVIPERTDEKNPPQPDKKEVVRKIIHVLVRNPKNNKVLILKWKKFPWTTFPMGGVDDDESLIEAAMREVKEETGYKNFKNAKVLGGQVKANYYANHKKENRIAYTSLVSLDLDNDEKDEISAEEKEIHDYVWQDISKLTVDNMTHSEMDIWLDRMNNKTEVYSGKGVMINSGQFNGLDSETAKEKITKFVKGKKQVQYKIRDWLVSRQRYWGAPIPIVYCDKCGEVPVPEKDLPIKLPEDVDFKPTGESPLKSSKTFHDVKCPKCSGKARRENDTLDTFVCSSWYFLRFLDPKNDKEPFGKDKAKFFLPVDLYVGGMEHAVGHLIYARFITKALRDLKFLDFDEPFIKIRNQGIILAEDSRKMSKRWGNVINPDDVIAEYGADAMRMFEMFMGPLEDSKPWSTKGIVGVRRFVERIWKISERIIADNTKGSSEIEKLLQQTIKKVTDDIEALKFNTAISKMMILAREFENSKSVSHDQLKRFLQILFPFAPHITSELWSQMEKTDITASQWPQYDKKVVREEEVEIVIQVNGKLKATLQVKKDTAEKEIIKLAENDDKVKKSLADKKIIKTIFVPGKILNFVVQ